MFKLRFLGAASEVGRSAFVLDVGEKFLLDFGVKLTPKGIEYPLPVNVNLKAAIISHAHLDHTGNLPHLYQLSSLINYMTPPTLELSKMLWFDTLKIAGLEAMDANFSKQEISRTERFSFPLQYRKEMEISDGVGLEFFDAGHVAGSAISKLTLKNDKVLVYTGDIKLDETRLHVGADLPEGKCDWLIIESTYGCLVGDSMITLMDGTELPIKDVGESVVVKSADNSFELGDYSVSKTWKHNYEGDLYTFVTESNKKITVTKNHPLFVNKRGKISIKNAFEVTVGDWLPVLKKKNDFVEELSLLHVFDLKLDHLVFIKLKTGFLKFLKSRTQKSFTSLSKTLCIPLPTLKDYFKLKGKYGRFYFMPLNIAKRLSVIAGVSFEELEKNTEFLKSKNSKLIIKNPFPLEKSIFLAKLLAKSFGDGHIRKKSMYFDYRNMSPELLNETRTLSTLLGFKEVKGSSDRTFFPFLGLVLHTLGCPQHKVNEELFVPVWVKNGSEDVKSVFLQGLFDDEGHVSNYVTKGKRLRRVLLKMAKNQNLTLNLITFFADLKQMLFDLGVDSKISFGKKYDDRIMLVLVVQGKNNIVNFNKKIGFVHAEKQQKLLGLVASNWEKEFGGYEKFEKILSIQKTYTSGTEVFDLTIGKLGNWGNFIANGIIVHNSRDHPDRKQTEKLFVESVQDTVDRGGIALVSTFALGRSAEMLDILNEYNVNADVYFDGMCQKAALIYLQYPKYLKNPVFLKKSLSKALWVKNKSMRKKAVKKPGIIITTSGMLQGGPVYEYLPAIEKDKNSTLYLTGFQVEETPGRVLLETGEITLNGVRVKPKFKVERYDFSSHAGREELFRIVRKLSPQKVFCVHGDKQVMKKFKHDLKQEGFDAFAPELGDELKL